jgi:hypothetical protein
MKEERLGKRDESVIKSGSYRGRGEEFGIYMLIR